MKNGMPYGHHFEHHKAKIEHKIRARFSEDHAWIYMKAELC